MNKLSKNKEYSAFLADIKNRIKEAQYSALKAVNKELIALYTDIGKQIVEQQEKYGWGKSIVETLANDLQKEFPKIKGFSSQNLWRMKQFYETYKDSKLSALLREMSWTNNLLILSKSKTSEEREFYLKLCIKEKYSSRDLERQIDSGFYERSMISSKKLSPVVRELVPNSKHIFKDTYILNFLDLSEYFDEKEFRKSIVKNFKNFVLEFGKDFAFLGEEYRLQVGNNDFFIDLLFYHRELRCLVAFELKIDDFKPEYLGKLNFYLEALDRDVKKTHENPRVGIILCKSKDREVVEYSLKRNMSPALISEYKTKLIPKRVLQKKMHELFETHKQPTYVNHRHHQKQDLHNKECSGNA